MNKIEIDFDVFKAITIRRKTESMSPNDVLRELFNLPPAQPQNVTPGKSWISNNVEFPHGTEFRATYKGRQYDGKVVNGALIVDNRKFNAPSAAAGHITGNSVNGWNFWECKRPGAGYWISIDKLRHDPLK